MRHACFSIIYGYASSPPATHAAEYPHHAANCQRQGMSMPGGNRAQQAATEVLAMLLQAGDPSSVAAEHVDSLDEQFFAIVSTYIAMVGVACLEACLLCSEASPGRSRHWAFMATI